MDKLIEKLEQATGPDRELDLAVLNVGAPKPWVWHDRERETVTSNRYGDGAIGNPVASIERFTESLDDAMGLVPEDAGLRLERYWLRDREAWTAVISTGGVPSNPARQFVAEDAHTPALALCIAAIKSRT